MEHPLKGSTSLYNSPSLSELHTEKRSALLRREDRPEKALTFGPHLLYFVRSCRRYSHRPHNQFWPDIAKSTICFNVGLSIYNPPPKAKEPIANFPSERLDGLIDLALFGNSLALPSTMGPKEGYLFMRLRIVPTPNTRPAIYAQHLLRDAPGYTRIAHNINEKLIMNSKSGLSINEIRVLFTILRNTIGRQRVKARLALSFISVATGLMPRRIREALKSLQRKKIIIKTAPHSNYPKQPAEWMVNLNWTEWTLKERGDKPVQGTKPVISRGTKPDNSQGTELCTNKDSFPKDRRDIYTGSKNIEKDFAEELKDDEVDYQIGG